jgi:hypothetical protein
VADLDSTGTTPAEGCPHLRDAEQRMDDFAAFTRAVANKLDEGYVPPHHEAQWRDRQNALMEMARTSALVSIAASLAVLAGRSRPQPDAAGSAAPTAEPPDPPST